MVGRADVVGLGRDRDLHRAVVTVVAALDLDDQVPAGDRPHEVDGVHGRLRAGVDEAPEGQVPTLTELLGHHDGVLGGLGEVGAHVDPAVTVSTTAGWAWPARPAP